MWDCFKFFWSFQNVRNLPITTYKQIHVHISFSNFQMKFWKAIIVSYQGENSDRHWKMMKFSFYCNIPLLCDKTSFTALPGHMSCHIFGALAHFCKTMHKTLLSKIVFIEEAVCKKKERTICFFDNFQKPSEPHSMGKYILTLQLDFFKKPVSSEKFWHRTVLTVTLCHPCK